MRKILSVLIILSFLISITSVYALGPNYFEASAEKGKHGIINTFTGWLELPYQVLKGLQNGSPENNKNDLVGGVLGIFRGIVHGIGRTASGILQLVTCLLPNHQDNQGVGVPLDNEYAWQEGTEYCLLKDGFLPLNEKALRGLTDAVGGVLEFPYQLKNASQQDSVKGGLLGVCKAIIYPVARVISGVFDLATLFLPNDSKTYGQPFDTKYPCPGLAELQEEIITEEPEVEDVYLSQVFTP
jgi:putative exosortase-associated protein (TIGR04073 family)